MLQDASHDLVSDAYWLLTAGSETRRNPPQSVRLGTAASALCDLTVWGEVLWNGDAEESTVAVREACRCPDEAMRGWHASLAEIAEGRALPVRFSLNPLVRTAWHDVACRLTQAGAAVEHASRLRLGRLARYSVRDLEAIGTVRHRLERALRDGQLNPLQRQVVGTAWASDSFDDLFRIHGVTVGEDLTATARDQLDGDALTARFTAALAYSRIVPTGGLQ